MGYVMESAFTIPLYTAPPAAQPEPTCPECKAAVLYECVACSSNNYPPVAQPEQEPVAWMADTGSVASLNEKEQGYVLKSAFNIPLYTTPPAAEPPAEWPLIKNILAEYGLDAIAFVAQWKAAQRPWQELTEQDMPSGEDPMFDHQYFCAGMVYAAKVLQEKNT